MRQLSPQLVVSEEEHRRRLGEALAAASSDAALRREDVEKRLQCATTFRFLCILLCLVPFITFVRPRSTNVQVKR